MSDITISINREIIAEIQERLARGLEMVGMVAEGHAKEYCPVDTGRLRGSITHTVVDRTKAVIGTNAEYAAYIEFGTGKHAANGAGTNKESWVYRDKFGNWHRAYPRKPIPFIGTAISSHADEYFGIVADELGKK